MSAARDYRQPQGKTAVWVVHHPWKVVCYLEDLVTAGLPRPTGEPEPVYSLPPMFASQTEMTQVFDWVLGMSAECSEVVQRALQHESLAWVLRRPPPSPPQPYQSVFQSPFQVPLQSLPVADLQPLIFAPPAVPHDPTPPPSLHEAEDLARLSYGPVRRHDNPILHTDIFRIPPYDTAECTELEMDVLELMGTNPKSAKARACAAFAIVGHLFHTLGEDAALGKLRLKTRVIRDGATFDAFFRLFESRELSTSAVRNQIDAGVRHILAAQQHEVSNGGWGQELLRPTRCNGV